MINERGTRHVRRRRFHRIATIVLPLRRTSQSVTVPVGLQGRLARSNNRRNEAVTSSFSSLGRRDDTDPDAQLDGEYARK